MANLQADTPETFVGRHDYVSRFKARLGHFRFFIYEGLSGIGKTALMRRLARECEGIGLSGRAYLLVHPGEGIGAILGRLACRLEGHGRVNVDHQGDPYVRLIELLQTHRQVLILDALHNLRRDDLITLTRILFKYKTGPFRVLGGIRGDSNLSAMDRGQLHLERVGALGVADVREMAVHAGVGGEALEILAADAARGGAVASPLILRCLLATCGVQLPPQAFLDSQSARSAHAFKMFMPHFAPHITPSERHAVTCLSRVAMPMACEVLQSLLGEGFEQARRHALVNVIGNDVFVHHCAAQVFASGEGFAATAAQEVAAHLHDRASRLGEPLAAIRAAEVLAHAGFGETAVESLAQSWQWARDPGFLEAYLKALATVPTGPTMTSRLKLLAVQARMRHGNPHAALGEVERLTQEGDVWTRSRALAAAAYIYSEIKAHAKVIAAYEAMRALCDDLQVLLPIGILAAEALVRAERLGDAQALIHTLLGDQPSASQEGELRRLQGRVDASQGRLTEAAQQVTAAAQCFATAGDIYHTATSYGTLGDLYRDAGEFQLAKTAYAEFLAVALKWGDRNLIQIAELADAWVSLDIGDVAHAAKKVALVQKDLGAAPSRRLKRTLAAAEALLEAGRGHHEKASAMLTEVVATWDAAGQRSLTGGLKAQLIRSLIACDKLDEAEATAAAALTGLDPAVHGARMASLLRESALIRLRRGQVDAAMQELAQARTLFAKGGNRREEALTLHRIAHAALDEGNIALATEKVAEALELATQIKHARAKALARELQSRLALLQDDAETALVACREAVSNLRRLGDELGVLHVSETLLRAYLFAGDLAMALRLGPKLRDMAARLEVPDLRARAVALTGIGLLRREKLKAATSCFRELPSKPFSPWTRALMGRFGEALALAQNNPSEALRRRAHWLAALGQLQGGRRDAAISALQQLALAPRDRCELRTASGHTLLGTEQAGLLAPQGYTLFVDVLYRRIYADGKPVKLAAPEMTKLLMRLVLAHPAALPHAAAWASLNHEDRASGDPKGKALLKEVQKGLQSAPSIQVENTPDGLLLRPPESFAFLLPVWLTNALSDTQKDILKLLRRLGSAPLQAIQDACKLSKSAVRRDIGELTKTKLVESVREGRGQVYRLA